jgi:hypothetical protein
VTLIWFLWMQPACQRHSCQNCIAAHANIWITEARQNRLPATTCAAAEAIELAGVDYMTVSPSVLDSLQATATMQGYNDGLSGAVTIRLSVHPAVTCWPLASVQHGSNVASTVTRLVTCAGAAEMDDGIERRLSPETAAAEEFSQSETATVTQQSFNEGLDQVDATGQCLTWSFSTCDCFAQEALPTVNSNVWPLCGMQAGLELLRQGVQGLVSGVERLLPDLGSIAIDAE